MTNQTPDTVAPHTTPSQQRPPAVTWAALMVGLSVILLGLLMLFIMPALKSGPQNLPLGIVATPEDSRAVSTVLNNSQPDSYSITPYESTEALSQAVIDRTVTGGFIVTDSTIETLVASAGSTAVSGTITATGHTLSEALHLAPTTTDVVPLPAGDPTGIGIGGLAFPLVFGGIVPAVAFRSLLPGRRGWILAGLLGFSAIGGFTVAAVLQFTFGSIEGTLWPVAGAVALGIAALALPLAALSECWGNKAFTLTAMVMMFIGNPFAGIATGSAWLPSGVALIGQLLPPGAAGTLVRAVAYFDGAGGAMAALTLGVWVAAGLTLWFLAPSLKRRAHARGMERSAANSAVA